MAKKQLAKDQDKFIVRLPPGMRDRIKAKAERAGMSMNEAVVWALNMAFPAPVTMEEKLDELATVVSMLKDSKDTYQGVNDLIGTIEETLFDVIWGKVPTSPDFRRMVEERHNYWQERLGEEYIEKHHNPFDDDDRASREEPPSDGDPFPNKDDIPF